jgi:hypothetical protein
LIRTLEAMRYREATSEEKTLWINEVLAWETYGDVLLPSEATVLWLSEGTPWATFRVEEIVYNVDVQKMLQ